MLKVKLGFTSEEKNKPVYFILLLIYTYFHTAKLLKTNEITVAISKNNNSIGNLDNAEPRIRQ